MYYRVEHIPPRSGGYIIEDSQFLNYETTLNRIMLFSYNENIPIDTMVQTNDKFATFGNIFFDMIPQADSNGMIDSSFCITNSQYRNSLIEKDKIIEFCQGITESNYLGSDAGLIWEYIFEYARQRVNCKLPSRLNSKFLFCSEKDARRYAIEQSYQQYSLHEVTISRSYNMGTFDLKWIDNIPLSATAREAYIAYAVKYWNKELTDNPLLEVLLQGEYTLGAKI